MTDSDPIWLSHTISTGDAFNSDFDLLRPCLSEGMAFSGLSKLYKLSSIAV